MVEDSNTENNGPKVHVKTLSDRLIQFPLDESLKTVADLKTLIATRESINTESIQLVSEGVVLLDGHLIESLPSFIQPSTQIKTVTVHWFHMEPLALTLNPIDTAKDWDAKNRLRCFLGIYHISRRNFVEASGLLTDCLPTFQDTSFITFKDLVKYAVLSALLVFERPDLSKKVHGIYFCRFFISRSLNRPRSLKLSNSSQS
jgi:hypothetical protein